MLGYSKQAYYKRLNQMEANNMNDHLILELVKNKRRIWKKGSGRNMLAAIKHELSEHSIKIGRDKFFNLLRENGMLMKNKKRRTNTTFSYHHFHKYPNIIIDVVASKPGDIIVSDITYIWLRDSESFAYLFLITDVYSRKIIGYFISDNLTAASAVKALKMAFKQIADKKDCIHHSDRGIQYCSYEYTDLLKNCDMKISMTENSDPRENAIAERVNRTIKEEFTDEKTISFKSFNQAKNSIPTFIKFYNEERPHRSIEMFTPSEAYTMSRELKRLWKFYPRKKNEMEDFAIIETEATPCNKVTYNDKRVLEACSERMQ